jgi:hypothetical protein
MKLGEEGISKFYYYRHMILFLNRLPFGFGKYIINLIDIFSSLINAIYGFIYTTHDFERIINYVEKQNASDKILSQLNVHVYNLTLNRSEIINGTHPLFKRYLIASLCRLTFFDPFKIRLLINECQCNENCSNCHKNKESIFIPICGYNVCNCDDIHHKFNEYVDNDICNDFSNLSSSLSSENSNNHINLVMISNCVEEKNKLFIRKTNFMARTIDLLKYYSQKRVDDIISKIHKPNDKTIVINYCKTPDIFNYEINPGFLCNLKESYYDGVKIRDILKENMKNYEDHNKDDNKDRNKIYIECLSN